MKHIFFISLFTITFAASAQVMREPLEQQQSTSQHLAAIQTPVNDRTIFNQALFRDSLFIDISKQTRTLFVYEHRCTGTALIAAYPVCLGANNGNKKAEGDGCTPETVDGTPFMICQISDASEWNHDFRDGRGSIPAYGNWFLRLKGDYKGSGIGIHGSTSNRYSVPGRGSEGCIRLRDEDIIHLKENYAFLGMKVFIESDIN